MKSDLQKFRQAEFVGVAELAGQAAKILTGSGLAQGRGTVTEVPDERTVRYYQAEGLLSPALVKRGTASVFGYRHLLQLLVVKHLQAEHLPIRKIRDLVEGRSEADLERLLGEGVGAPVKNEAQRYLEELLTKAPPRAAAPAAQQSAPQAMYQAGAAQAPAQAPAASTAGGTWARLELEPGLELHVHEGYQPPAESKGLRRLAQLVLRALESFGHRPGKRGS